MEIPLKVALNRGKQVSQELQSNVESCLLYREAQVAEFIHLFISSFQNIY